ncbi:MAG: hypothetical protein WC775_01690 [Patescibacteria group bacterium]|jgi:hypothetical protein
MNLFTEYPVIPGITFLLIVAFFAYQLHLLLKERRKKITPKLPNMAVQTAGVRPAKLVVPEIKKSTSPQSVDAKKRYGPIVQMLSVLLLLLVLVSTMGIVYVFRSQNLASIPRANSPQPTSQLDPLNSLPSPGTASPDTSASDVLEISPTTTIPTVTAIPIPTTIPTTSQTISTPIPTVKAQAQKPGIAATSTPSTIPSQFIPSMTPTPILIAKISAGVSPSVVSPSTVPTTTSPAATQQVIPEAGFPWYLGIFILGSIAFLAIGFIW